MYNIKNSMVIDERWTSFVIVHISTGSFFITRESEGRPYYFNDFYYRSIKAQCNNDNKR